MRIRSDGKSLVGIVIWVQSERMKTTAYDRFMKLRADRAPILDEWVERVVASPIFREIQEDGRIRLWGDVSEMDNRCLRVILLEDGETVHNAFFDRRFKHNEG